MSFIQSEDPRRYTEYLTKDIRDNSCTAKGVIHKLKGISKPMLSLLQSMIEFNPYFRPSASEMLYSEVFS